MPLIVWDRLAYTGRAGRATFRYLLLNSIAILDTHPLHEMSTRTCPSLIVTVSRLVGFFSPLVSTQALFLFRFVISSSFKKFHELHSFVFRGSLRPSFPLNPLERFSLRNLRLVESISVIIVIILKLSNGEMNNFMFPTIHNWRYI